MKTKERDKKFRRQGAKSMTSGSLTSLEAGREPMATPARSGSAERTSPAFAPISGRTCTDLNSLCYNSFTGQGQLLWVRVACSTVFGQRFSLVSMVSINLAIRFYGVEIGDAGESIEPEESH